MNNTKPPPVQPIPKKNYIDTSSTLKNLEADRTVNELQKKMDIKHV